MKLKEILSHIDLLMPSRYSDEDWISMLNAAIRQHGRSLGRSSLYVFTGDGKAIYPLPPSVLAHELRGVVVGETMYEPVRYGEELKDCTFCLDPNGYLMLSTGVSGTVKILYLDEHPFMTIEQMDEESAEYEEDIQERYQNQDCGIDDEYIDAIIYYAMAMGAEGYEDINAAANYRQQADEIVRMAKQSRYQKQGKYPKTKMTAKMFRRCAFRTRSR